MTKPGRPTSASPGPDPELRRPAPSIPPASDRFFRTDGVRADLRGSSVRSSLLVLGTRGTQSVLSLGATMVLARILTPADFGIIAMVLPIAMLITSISVQGLQTTLIQDDGLDHGSASLLFRQAALFNLAIATAFCAIAPVLARFYDEPRVIRLALAWAAILFGSALFSFPEALLKRQMRFGTLAVAHVGALTAGIAAAVTAARLGLGHWALLIQIGVLELGRGGVATLACGWFPAMRGLRRSPVTRRMRAFWFGLTGFRLTAWVGEQPDRLLVGQLGGPTALGLYDGARRWSSYAFFETFNALSDVVVASFSRLSSDPTRYRAFAMRGLLPIFAVSLPAMAFLFVEAQHAILVLLGDQWLDAVPFVRIMCVAFFFASAGRVTQWFYFSLGQTRRQFRWTLFANTPITLLGIAIGYRWGVMGIATGYAIATSALALPSVAFCLRRAPFTFTDFLRVTAVPATASILAAAALAVLRPWLPSAGNALLDLTTAAAAYAILLTLAWLLLPGGRASATGLFQALNDLRRPSPRSA